MFGLVWWLHLGLAVYCVAACWCMLQCQILQEATSPWLQNLPAQNITQFRGRHPCLCTYSLESMASPDLSRTLPENFTGSRYPSRTWIGKLKSSEYASNFKEKKKYTRIKLHNCILISWLKYLDLIHSFSSIRTDSLATSLNLKS